VPYISRDDSGKISAISQITMQGFSEQLDSEDSELQAFVVQLGGNEGVLRKTDLDFIRVVEDLIELLVHKNVVCFTDLPPEAQAKMLARQQIRASMNKKIDLIDDDFGLI